VLLKRDILETIIEAAWNAHPRETLFLLRGSLHKGEAVVEELLVPPLANYGYGFTSFPSFMLPFDPSIIGSAHSHPSGSLRPSVEDLNLAYGAILIIIAYPYGEDRIAAYNGRGNRLTLKLV